MGNTFDFAWEVSLIEFIQANFPEWLISILKVITEFGSEVVLVGILGFVYWCFDKNKGRKMVLSLCISSTIFPLFKNIFFRNRPYVAHDTIKCLKPVDADADIYDLNIQGYSFPSGHASVSSSAFGSIFKEYKNSILRILCILIIVLVGLSRFTLGVHYPTDVLVGWCVGIGGIILVNYLDKKVDKKIYYPIIWIIAAVGFFYCKSTDYYSSYGLLLGATIGDIFERKFVNFDSTKNVLEIIVRLIGGFAIFLGLNALLKLPFSNEFLDTNAFLPHLVRTVRYTIVSFIDLGVYPLLFKYIKFKGAK